MTALDMDELERIIARMDLIAETVEEDMASMDGHPLTGAVLGAAFGNDRAAIVALARSVQALAKEVARLSGDGVQP